MKKLYLSVIVAFLACMMISCGKFANGYDKGLQEPLVLGAWAKVDTKAIVMDDEFPAMRSMCVSADFCEDAGTKGSYFTDVAFNHAVSGWKAAGSFYWPYRGHLDILAYSAGDVYLTDTWDGASSVVLLSDDFTADDVLAGGIASADKDNNFIVFGHVLSLVNVMAVSNSPEYVNIKRITLNGYRGAEITVSRQQGVSEVDVATVLMGEPDSIILFDGNYVAPDVMTTFGNGIIVPEQHFTECTITYTHSVDGGETPALTLTGAVDIDCRYGKSYVLKVHFNMNEITFSVDVSNWVPDSYNTIMS